MVNPLTKSRIKGLVFLMLVSGMAHAADWDTLLKAMQKGRNFMPAGTVEVVVNFPPSANPVRSRKDLPQLSFLPGLVRKNFELAFQESQMLAGRSSTMYTLSPKNRLSNAWTIWVDDLWQVPVAYQQQDLEGNVLRRAAFQSFKGTLPRLKTPFKQELKYNAALESSILRALPGLKLPQPYRVVGLKATQFRDVQSTEIYLSDGINLIPVIIASKGVQKAEGVAVVKLKQQFVWVVAKFPDMELLNIIEHLKDIRTDQLPDTGE